MPRTRNDQQVDLVTEMREIGLRIDFAPGGGKYHGEDPDVISVNDALAFDRDETTDLIVKMPRLYVAKSCRNTIFCWQTWKDAEGQVGATKDFCDHARWFMGRECKYIEAIEVRPTQTSARMPNEGFCKYLDRTQRGGVGWGAKRGGWGRRAR